MRYSENFKKAVSLAQPKGFYLGTGSPDSKILIIGKENAHESGSERDKIAKEEINKWKENIDNNTDISLLENSCFNHDLLNPLYPFKGQLNRINNNVNGGTSRTWFNYQKLYDNIFNNSLKSEYVNFHSHIFITELNENPSQYSHLQDKQKRQESVDARCEFFKGSDFFRIFLL